MEYAGMVASAVLPPPASRGTGRAQMTGRGLAVVAAVLLSIGGCSGGGSTYSTGAGGAGGGSGGGMQQVECSVGDFDFCDAVPAGCGFGVADCVAGTPNVWGPCVCEAPALQ